jgi:two-component system chemotaxis sensor kinase CheA
MDPMDAIKQTFFQECDEQLAELETGLLAMQNGDSDSETVNAVFRAVHSVKGGAGAFGLDSLVRFAHVFETTLDAMRSDKLAGSPELLKAMLRAADVLADLVRGARGGAGPNEQQVAMSAAELAALTAAPGPAAASPQHAQAAPVDDGFAGLMFQPVQISTPEPDTTTWHVKFRPHPALYAKGNDAALLLRELALLGDTSVTLDTSDLPDLADLDPEGAYLTWHVDLQASVPESSVQEVFEFVEGDCDIEISMAAAGVGEASPEPPVDVLAFLQQLQAPTVEAAAVTAAPARALASPPADTVATSPKEELHVAPPPRDEPIASPKPTIRVDLDRVDRLIDLVGELVINGAMLTQRSLEAGLGRSSAVTVGLDELQNLTREIQDSVMAIRAQPVKSVFARMPRLVREVAAMVGKQARLVTEGEGTEVDKTVIEHLADPLTHMIRNAIDHGLESPEQRRLAGKPELGTVRLAAMHRSGRIVIEVSDDGAGINRARVRESAIEKGLIAADVVLSDEETDNLIFLAGFSTAATISDISGRGVGMDVVRRSIQALGGRIAITSRPGLGSTFTLSLPLTLAVLDGMVVTVADQTLIVPLTAIIETLQPRQSAIHDLGEGAQVLNIRGTYIPLLCVGTILGWTDTGIMPGSVALLVEGDGGSRAALLVDAIQGQQQVVIKSLEANYQQVPGVAAATILGDGRVALILDVDGMVSDARGEGQFAESHSELGLTYA